MYILRQNVLHYRYISRHLNQHNIIKKLVKTCYVKKRPIYCTSSFYCCNSLLEVSSHTTNNHKTERMKIKLMMHNKIVEAQYAIIPKRNVKQRPLVVVSRVFQFNGPYTTVLRIFV